MQVEVESEAQIMTTDVTSFQTQSERKKGLLAGEKRIITVRMPEAMIEALEQIASERNTDRSSVMLNLLADCLSSPELEIQRDERKEAIAVFLRQQLEALATA